MKPTALQDAIKAMAAAKQSRRAQGEWQEPVVKKFTMSAQEYEDLKKGSSSSSSGHRSPAAVPSPPATSGKSSSTTQGASVAMASSDEMKALVQQMAEERSRMTSDKEKILREMKDLKTEVKLYAENASQAAHQARESARRIPPSSASAIPVTSMTPVALSSSVSKATEDELRTLLATNQTDIQTLQNTVKDLHGQLGECRSVVADLQASLKELVRDKDQWSVAHDTMRTEHSATLVKLSRLEKKIDTVQEESRINRNVFDHFVVTEDQEHPHAIRSVPNSPVKTSLGTVPATPATLKSPISFSSANASSRPRSRSRSRGRSTTTIAKPDTTTAPDATAPPYTSEELYEAQRKDKALRDYMKSNSQEGLPYTAKQTSIEILEGYKLMYFRKRVYIPAKLRSATTQFYVATYGRDEALAYLSKYCIWPSLEDDCRAYLSK